MLANASAFVAAGHQGQYDLGLGLTRLLVGQAPQPTDRNFVLTLVVPTAAWAVVALLLVVIGRHLVRLRRGPQRLRRRSAPRWLRRLLPGGAFLVVGAGMLAAAPLGTVRHFYPDTRWALTLIAYIATARGVTRIVLDAPTTDRSGEGPPGPWSSPTPT